MPRIDRESRTSVTAFLNNLAESIEKRDPWSLGINDAPVLREAATALEDAEREWDEAMRATQRVIEQRDEARQEVARLREGLERLAYSNGLPFSEPGRLHPCPVCGAHETWPNGPHARGHWPECWLGAALAIPEGGIHV